MNIIHISFVNYSEVLIRSLDCPTCKRKRFMVVAHTPWHGTDLVCLRCGERWEDGARADRPFERGWRKKSIEEAKGLYRKYHPRTQLTTKT
jgi:hypothetical protein